MSYQNKGHLSDISGKNRKNKGLNRMHEPKPLPDRKALNDIVFDVLD